MRDMLEARKRGDYAFRDKDFKAAIDCYSQVSFVEVCYIDFFSGRNIMGWIYVLLLYANYHLYTGRLVEGSTVPCFPLKPFTKLITAARFLLIGITLWSIFSVQFIDVGTMVSPTVFARRSLCYLLNEQPDAALRDAMQAQCVYPDWPTAFYMQSVALAKLDMHKDAGDMLNEATTLEEKRQRGGRGS